MSIWETLSPYELSALILVGLALSAPIHIVGFIHECWKLIKQSVLNNLVWAVPTLCALAILALYLVAVEDVEWSKSESWKDLASFFSGMATPIVTLVAVFIAFKQLRQSENKHAEDREISLAERNQNILENTYAMQVKNLQSELEKLFIDIDVFTEKFKSRYQVLVISDTFLTFYNHANNDDHDGTIELLLSISSLEEKTRNCLEEANTILLEHKVITIKKTPLTEELKNTIKRSAKRLLKKTNKISTELLDLALKIKKDLNEDENFKEESSILEAIITNCSIAIAITENYLAVDTNHMEMTK